MYPILLLAVAATGPVVDGAVLSVPAQWEALAACPRVLSRADGGVGTATGTGITVAARDGFAYVLTALHAVPDGAVEREVQFFTRESYPEPARKYLAVEVAARWADPDLALLRVKVGADPVYTLPLARPGERPMVYPYTALSIGCSNGSPPTCRPETVSGKRPARRANEAVAFFWELATPPVPGRSGGPLLDTRGRVIGVCAAGQDGKGYYTHLDEVLFGLKRQGYDWLWRAGK